jgi:signal peptidase I
VRPVSTIGRIGGREFEELAVQLLGAGHAVRFRARGSSMHPAVRDGDILDVCPVSSAGLHIGDIVLYRSSRSGIVVHRVVDIRRQEEKTILLVKGDFAARADPQVEQSQVLGRVESIQRRDHTILPTGWASRHVAPLHARLFRLRRWAYRLLKQARMGLRKMLAAGGSGV